MLLKIEIIIFLISAGYILFFFIDYVYIKFERKFLTKKRINDLDVQYEQKQKEEKLQQEQEADLGDTHVGIRVAGETKTDMDNVSVLENITEKFNSDKSEKLRDITKRAQMNISRGYLETARSLVVEGLAMKKNDKALNILLAEIYEREKKYQQAAYVYQDLLENFPGDGVIMQKLGNSLYLIGDYKEAFDVYQLAHKKNRANTEILDILSHIALDIQDYKLGIKYANLYLKEKPRNAEKLGIKAYCLEKSQRHREAIDSYKKILDIQPYNTEVRERISRLEKTGGA